MDQHNTFISKNSLFRGDISAERIVVAGVVFGNLTASSAVVIEEYGRVKGDIRAPKVYIAQKCFHEGLICLENPDEPDPDKVNIGTVISESGDVKTGGKNTPEKAASASRKKETKLL